jgi:hypothetical protein
MNQETIEQAAEILQTCVSSQYRDGLYALAHDLGYGYEEGKLAIAAWNHVAEVLGIELSDFLFADSGHWDQYWQLCAEAEAFLLTETLDVVTLVTYEYLV